MTDKISPWAPLQGWLQSHLRLEALRLSFVFAPLMAFIFIQCLQSEFINLGVWMAVFAALSLSFLMHIVYLLGTPLVGTPLVGTPLVGAPLVGSSWAGSSQAGSSQPGRVGASKTGIMAWLSDTVRGKSSFWGVSFSTGVFFVDALVLNALMFYTGIGSSVFVLLLLLNLLLCGLHFSGTKNAYWLAVWTSGLYSVVLMLSPDVSTYNLYLSIVINNMAFFVVAGLAHTLGGQLRGAAKSLSGAKQELSGAKQQVAHQQGEIERLQRLQIEQEKMAAVGQLASGVAHEIRNPLASVSGSVQMLSQSVVLNDEARKLTTIITKEVDRLNNLLTDLLDFVKPPALRQDPVDVDKIMREVLQVVKLNKDLDSGIEYVYKSFDDAMFSDVSRGNLQPPLVAGDAEKLKQAFLNLVLNAAQAVQENHDLEKARVCIELEAQSVGVCVRVSDNGVGMKSTDNIFEPFHTTKKGGTGLGLAIVQKIIHAHRGEIDVQSQPGQGSCFRVVLPLKAAERNKSEQNK